MASLTADAAPSGNLSSDRASADSRLPSATREGGVLRLSGAQLLELARAQAPGVEDHIYALLQPTVNRLVWSLLGRDQEHNDIVHEVFIQIFRNIWRVRDPASLEAWAARVTINIVRNEMRRRRLRRWVFWDPFEDPGPLQHVMDVDGQELLSRTYALLGKLPVSERLILSLRLFEPGTLDHIARLAGLSRSGAKRLLRKARERFAKLAHVDPLLRDWIGASGAATLEAEDE